MFGWQLVERLIAAGAEDAVAAHQEQPRADRAS